MLVARAHILFFTALLLLAAVSGRAQSSTLGKSRPLSSAVWLTLTSDARLTDRWGSHLEAQWRQAKGAGSPHQNVLRLGITYHATGELQLSTGYALLLTTDNNDAPAAAQRPEHRAYQQVLLNDLQDRLQLQHRYRLEQRWIQQTEGAAPVYVNRIRYRLQLAYPLSGPVLKTGGAYVAASNELFLGFGRNVEHGIFDQNRAYAGLGYQAMKSLALEIGYQNQLASTNVGSFGSPHSVQVGLKFNPDFRPVALLAAVKEAGAK
ncbi:DUF2490 domain-containing protein [Hymenobacter cellulosilyticus]|uniref:DUF2490 domain-containing protein n=1 Tax=Hymenobacter cellulosilyticus TaxID=2932248 RepID=A0A8T9Q4G0_9BACT|nr:DUF2490 domain-containing protein [Hymenobacter cellulosilyticus]UOQ72387.1 DUF2490 domain-containing protein [Hymenobacter cellulosilyticus]